MFRCQLRNNLGHRLAIFRHSSCDVSSRSRKDAFNSRRVANQDDRIARYTRFTPIIDLQKFSVRLVLESAV